MPERLTLTEVFSLFGCTAGGARRVWAADSAEYLTVVTYLVQRSNRSPAL